MLLKVDPPQSLVIDLLGGGSQRYLDHNYVWDFEKMRIRVRRDVQALRNGGFEIKVFTDSAQGPRLNSNWAQRREIDLQVLLSFSNTLQKRFLISRCSFSLDHVRNNVV